MNWKHLLTILTGTALPALITALAGHPITAETVVQALGGAIIVTIGVLLKSPAASALVLVVAIGAANAACTPGAQSAANATGEAVCQVVATAADPALAPLCIPAEAVAALIEQLTDAALDAGTKTQVTAALLAVTPPDAGTITTVTVTPAQWHWLVQHGAHPVGDGG